MEKITYTKEQINMMIREALTTPSRKRNANYKKELESCGYSTWKPNGQSWRVEKNNGYGNYNTYIDLDIDKSSLTVNNHFYRNKYYSFHPERNIEVMKIFDKIDFYSALERPSYRNVVFYNYKNNLICNRKRPCKKDNPDMYDEFLSRVEVPTKYKQLKTDLVTAKYNIKWDKDSLTTAERNLRNAIENKNEKENKYKKSCSELERIRGTICILKSTKENK